MQNAIRRGICIKKHMLWCFAALLALMTKAMAKVGDASTVTEHTIIVVNTYGMTAPFLISWVPIWVFATAGGVGSIFIKIPEIDKHFRWLLIAKPFLGLFGGISLCLVVTDGSEPPQIALAAYALVVSLLSAPILQMLIAVVTIPKNQAGLVNAINPFKFKIVVDDSREVTDAKHND